ncbi:molybdopterin molybdenumtransferase MoeA [Agaricicola taiwanensis]|uniref:Molybdopterin molybdenumtransferase n=1 Tax=Agaricicola taiwanensis TaxID=591372 RepID=A0A8J2YI51_9RHOB|nr:gephyrin-like molybdotransferase Glp [Agaricicola taiwanensis]GGE44522.1 molybdopterin molybdenumtransferase MoeA [Agaricicola taiwanensis]
MLSVDEARERILTSVAPLSAERVPLSQSHGRILAAPLEALRTQPPFDVSAMDGYALRAADAEPGRQLTIIGTSQAGCAFDGTLAAGTAVRIFTGAPLPNGADAVLIQENAERDGDFLTPLAEVKARQNIRHRGLDFQEGDIVFDAGRRLTARDLGLAAGLGHASLPLRRRPTVAILATGDELVLPGEMPGKDQIIATSSTALAVMVEAEGGIAHDLGIARDTVADLKAAIARVRDMRPDVFITLGGASVGDHDLIRQVFEQEGMRLDFWKIAMRPGKPMIFGWFGETPLLGLPGNPVSAQICALLFLKPMLRKLQGRTDLLPSLEVATLASDLPANGPREDYMRATLSEGPEGIAIRPFDVQDSSMTRSLALADALLVRPAHEGEIRAGAPCRFLRLGLSD